MIPLSLACLQAYLKAYSIPVKVFNFRTDGYKLAKMAVNPLSGEKPPRFIMNHQDLPILITIVDKLLEEDRVNLDSTIFQDLFNDYSMRINEDVMETLKRYKSILGYLEEIVSELNKDYSTIGFSVDYLNIPEVVLTSVLLKKFNPKIRIIWGGASITQSYDAFKLFLMRKVCDGLVIGEGEMPMLEISQCKNFEDIKGLMSFNNGTINFKPGIQLDLNSLPSPDYTDIPLDTYFGIASVYRSRGCTNRCKFCGEWFLFGKRFRVRSVENVVSDIETIINKTNPKYMIFGESLINDDLEYFDKLCDALIEKNFNIEFGTHFRANITLDLAKKARKAGFNDAWVGFEAFTDKELGEMNKGVKVSQNLKTIDNFSKASINVLAMLVIGFSTLDEEKRNCENIVNIIEKYSKEQQIDAEGKKKPISIQWRPSYMCLVPGSLDYRSDNRNTKTWSCNSIHFENRVKISHLEKELSKIKYEFECSIPDKISTSLLRKIIEVDRISRFAVGGITKHVINFIVKSRKKNRISKMKNNLEIIGVAQQRTVKS